MKQTIQINAEIPENYTLVETEWLNNLMKQTLPTYWTMKDLRKDTRMSDYSIKKYILERPEFQKELEGIWFKSTGGGKEHSFSAKKMKAFLERNEQKIKELEG